MKSFLALVALIILAEIGVLAILNKRMASIAGAQAGKAIAEMIRRE